MGAHKHTLFSYHTHTHVSLLSLVSLHGKQEGVRMSAEEQRLRACRTLEELKASVEDVLGKDALARVDESLLEQKEAWREEQELKRQEKQQQQQQQQQQQRDGERDEDGGEGDIGNEAVRAEGAAALAGSAAADQRAQSPATGRYTTDTRYV